MNSLTGKIQHWMRAAVRRLSIRKPTAKTPDFICIGAQKGGTSWLYHELDRHPQVKMPQIKELGWFYDRNTTWEEYLSHFALAVDHVTGDITPRYMLAGSAAAEMRQRLPRARVFALLRNPTDRAFSQYRMTRAKHRIPADLPFLEAFERDTGGIRSRGHYAELLTPYLAQYRLGENFEVFLHDDLKRDAVSFIHSVDRFLGIREYASPQVHEYYRSPLYSNDGLKITPAERQALQKYYVPFNNQLADLLGRYIPRNAAAAA